MLCWREGAAELSGGKSVSSVREAVISAGHSSKDQINE